MILSNRAILEALDQGRIRITPVPTPRPDVAPNSPYDTTAVDLSLGAVVNEPITGVGATVEPSEGDVLTTLRTLYRPIPIDDREGYTLRPRAFVLAQTLEQVELPLMPPGPAGLARRCLAARVEGKSSLARFGLLVHFTAPTIHAGFRGPIALEMMNLGERPIRLRTRMRICELIIEEVEGVPLENPSPFQDQQSATG